MKRNEIRMQYGSDDIEVTKQKTTSPYRSPLPYLFCFPIPSNIPVPFDVRESLRFFGTARGVAVPAVPARARFNVGDGFEDFSESQVTCRTWHQTEFSESGTTVMIKSET